MMEGDVKEIEVTIEDLVNMGALIPQEDPDRADYVFDYRVNIDDFIVLRYNVEVWFIAMKMVDHYELEIEVTTNLHQGIYPKWEATNDGRFKVQVFRRMKQEEVK